jgi:hypothetical protein
MLPLSSLNTEVVLAFLSHLETGRRYSHRSRMPGWAPSTRSFIT